MNSELLGENRTKFLIFIVLSVFYYLKYKVEDRNTNIHFDLTNKTLSTFDWFASLKWVSISYFFRVLVFKCQNCIFIRYNACYIVLTKYLTEKNKSPELYAYKWVVCRFLRYKVKFLLTFVTYYIHPKPICFHCN